VVRDTTSSRHCLTWTSLNQGRYTLGVSRHRRGKCLGIVQAQQRQRLRCLTHVLRPLPLLISFTCRRFVTARARFINDMGHLARHRHADGRRNDALQKDLGWFFFLQFASSPRRPNGNSTVRPFALFTQSSWALGTSLYYIPFSTVLSTATQLSLQRFSTRFRPGYFIPLPTSTDLKLWLPR